MDRSRGRRLAIHEAHNRPRSFARSCCASTVWTRRDLECVVRAPVDYQMDLRRLRDGSIDAAYVAAR